MGETMELQVWSELIQSKPTLGSRIARRIRGAYRYDTAFWRSAAAGPWGAGMFAFILLALGMPTGLSAAIDILLFMLAGTLSLFLAAHLTALLLALIGLPIPRLFAGIVLFDLLAVFFIFEYNEVSFAAAAVVSAVVTLAGIAVGLAAGTMANGRIRLRHKAGVVGLIALLVLVAAVWPNASEDTAAVPAFHNADTDGGLAEDLDSAVPATIVPDLSVTADNPAEPGPYEVSTFYYGSGKDVWQPEYGADVDVKSKPVDASAYIKKWSVFRTTYWGFNQRALPVNGRVWMPDAAEGNTDKRQTYPLVLIVHGNHLMEDYSDDGYAYLGKLLASRGFAVVSVDENFLNYSVWRGIPDNDMKVRAWMLLKHLQQIGEFAAEPGNPFYGKIDFGQIGLAGHSRGGQAVAMAADYKNWFSGDAALLKSLEPFRIRAVAAIAPTDKKVDGKYTKLRNVSYLTLQGARDGDVSDFDGDRQYMRTSYSPESDRFKASIYIADANHSQFNSSWGGRDVSYPKGILLSRDGMLSPAEQRTIAKVYISAFLEESLERADESSSGAAPGRYLPLLQDYRTGLAWLPHTAYYNRFESGAFTAWARYDEDMNRMTLPGGGTAEADGLGWKEEDAKNRQNSSKPTRGIVLERPSDKSEPSDYSLSWKQSAPWPAADMPEWLAFSLTDRSFELEPEGSPDAALASGATKIEVELVDAGGGTARLPLTQFGDPTPLPVTAFTIHPWLDRHLSDGKYKRPTEAVFQTYRLPLEAFASAGSDFDPGAGIKRLTFRLSGSTAKIMLDDIGVY
ncbi:alpha/beta hydrolase family protein [Paenibacillus macerans]|uniref:alpha/beta hydrolase family protein n=1 Tax=Paenibacillus macerans TaxID=44252 RepID=UPI003D3192A9